jgi:hypothetical protein
MWLTPACTRTFQFSAALVIYIFEDNRDLNVVLATTATTVITRITNFDSSIEAM